MSLPCKLDYNVMDHIRRKIRAIENIARDNGLTKLHSCYLSNDSYYLCNKKEFKMYKVDCSCTHKKPEFIEVWDLEIAKLNKL